MSQKIGFDKILIYGLGIIGGSIAKKLRITNYKLLITNDGKSITNEELPRQASPATPSKEGEFRIYGIARREETVKQALELGIVDDAATDFSKFSGEVDFLIFSLPPMKIAEILKEIFPYLKNDVLITDVSSVKGKDYDEIKNLVAENNLKYDKKVVYIGSHPMAGSEKKGLENSTEDMLDDSMVLITPFDNEVGVADLQPLQQIEKFWQDLGCRTKIMSVKDHDIFTAYTSHFNHLLSGMITNILHDQFKKNPDIKFAIGGSFRDMTRIPVSDSELWIGIVQMNRENIKKVLEDYKKNIIDLEQILDEGKSEKILNFLKDAKKNRSELLDK